METTRRTAGMRRRKGMKTGMRLIDAEKLEKFIEHGLNNPDKNKRFGHDAIEIMTEVHFSETVDVAPVVHGRWGLLPVSIRSVKKTNIPEAVCSVCGGRFCDITNSVSLYRFCPNCGAKMDLDNERA